jgi:hypothetical protein
MRRLTIGIVCVGLLSACDKTKDAAPTPSASVSKAPVAIVDSRPAQHEGIGEYDAQPGTLTVPAGAEWKGVKFRGDDAGEALGKGTLKLTIDPDGQAHGEGDGPFGPFLVAGTSSGDVLTFSVRRKDPSDMGLTGTGRGTLAKDKIEGTIHASKATANVIREATFSLHR